MQNLACPHKTRPRRLASLGIALALLGNIGTTVAQTDPTPTS